MSQSSNESHRVSRRAFNGRLAAAGMTLAGMAGSASGAEEKCGAKEKCAADEKHPAGKYVDVHVHLEQEWFSGGKLTPKMMLDWMDKQQVAQAVVLPLVCPESWSYPISTHWVLEQTAPYRDRLIPFCDIDPRCTYLKGVKGFLAPLKKYVDAGAKGLGEHKCGGPIDDPKRLDLFRACGELKLPILFHMDSIRNTDKPGLPGLARVLEAVPDSVFIGHAPGWWSALADGTMDRLMEKYPNIYADLSAGSGARAVGSDMKFGREFVIRRADRLCFGTDYLKVGQKIPQFELYEKLDLPPDVQAKVFRDNARRVLGLLS